MISKAERQHIVQLKQWSIDSRAALHAMQEHATIGRLLKKILPTEQNTETVFDNIDWLVALIERESHTAGVKAILREVESKK